MVIEKKLTERETDRLNFAVHKEDIRKAADQAKTTMADAASLAAKAIAEAAGQAKVAIAEAAAVSVKVLSVKNADDHDLLIELKVGNNFIRDDIKNLSNGLTTKIDLLEKTKVDKKEFEELANEIHGSREIRMRNLENKTANFFITMGLVMIGVGALFTLFIIHIYK